MAMSPQSSRPLNQEVDRCKVGDERIEVEIQRLLDDLGCDEHLASAVVALAIILSAALAEHPLDSLFDFQAVYKRKPCMKQ